MFKFDFFKRFYEKITHCSIDRNTTTQILPAHFKSNDTHSLFDYSFMMSLPEKDYPKFLSQVYYIKFLKKLNLKNPKTINEKIQWLKLYDNMDIKTTLTDKVLVRDWIKERIGDKFIKPMLWVGNNFADIPFDTLPDSFILKANHGCKWNIVIKDKTKLISNGALLDYTKRNVTNWLSANYFGLSDFETQYKNIKPQLLIEPYFSEIADKSQIEYEIWCFNDEPKIIQKYYTDYKKQQRIVSTFDENFENINLKFLQHSELVNGEAENLLKQATRLSKILAQNFKLVRVDWIVFNNQLYFNEMTFTPHSGYIIFSEEHKDWYLKLGKMLNLKGKK